jgi:hypothetical protein
MLDISLEAVRDRALERARTRLAKFVAPARKQGVSVEYSAECYSWKATVSISPSARSRASDGGRAW